MAGTKIQGREKPTKIEQKKVKERSKDRSEAISSKGFLPTVVDIMVI